MTRHPVEIYAALLLLMAVAGLLAMRNRSLLPPAAAAASALAAAAAVRLATEPLRPTLGNGPVGWYWLGLITGLGLLGWSQRRHVASWRQPPATGNSTP